MHVMAILRAFAPILGFSEHLISFTWLPKGVGWGGGVGGGSIDMVVIQMPN